MRSESRRVRVSVPRAAAYDYLVDYRNDEQWRPELKDVALTSGVPGEPGAKYQGSIDWHGLVVQHELELLSASRPDFIRARSATSDLTIEVAYTLTDDGDGCWVNADYTLSMTGPLILLEPFGWALLMGWVNDDLPCLDEVLSATDQAT